MELTAAPGCQPVQAGRQEQTLDFAAHILLGPGLDSRLSRAKRRDCAMRQNCSNRRSASGFLLKGKKWEAQALKLCLDV